MKQSNAFKEAVITEFTSMLKNYGINQNTISLSNRKGWSKEIKNIYRNAYSRCYNQVKAHKKIKAQTFWLEKINNGCFDELFKKYGLEIYDGKIKCINCGSVIIQKVLKELINDLEKDFNIHGIKYNKKATCNCRDLLDWSNANINSADDKQ